MTIEEVWEIKKEVSKETHNKSVEELRELFKPCVDEFNATISMLRNKNTVAFG